MADFSLKELLALPVMVRWPPCHPEGPHRQMTEAEWREWCRAQCHLGRLHWGEPRG